ncbi:MAG: 50S ribosomal protein L13 [Microgenomates group bacterium GW2011_GWA1_48_10]|uniref:Large ribosomal subunit protein uL13 n=1 Tax=Candidatus Gottesmanbacteria bacterium RIFCSPHIGHO2_01_FULL_47_48 TaxID=1798381 RepID=A0A1F6A2F7_9BACT|nr:MAG: 50S ribosomal protein L13 [Microgenomates group bacterium GW2011_GWA1_48_10]OGG18853.1 MAG: 50S ribosomal protein L13 [Candidatus Gottesmanbacteria bacterium RIFCSPHIGHO2_01_FULL_47_48]
MITKLSDIKHDKHTLDAKDVVLGRLATRAATLLVGKSKPYFTRHLDCGDFVTVSSAAGVKITGNKEAKKTYTRYSGYPGGLKKTTLKTLKASNPTKVIYNAISGMLPDNKLKKFWLARLKIEN